MSFLLACIDHRLARLESAARTFLRSDLHRRVARAAVERDAFDGADVTCALCGNLRSERACIGGAIHGGKVPWWNAAALAAFEEENECLEGNQCENCDGRKCMGCVFREYDHDCADDCPDCCHPTNVPADLAASGTDPGR